MQGCDASLMLKGNNTEQSDPGNRSVGGFSVIDGAKRVIEIFCPETVSCADIIALAARDAVEVVSLIYLFSPHCMYCSCIFSLSVSSYNFGLNNKTGEQAGGPRIQIPTGRRDGMVSAASNVRPNIVDTSFTMDEMAKLFNSKGLTLDDLVILSGYYCFSSIKLLMELILFSSLLLLDTELKPYFGLVLKDHSQFGLH